MKTKQISLFVLFVLSIMITNCVMVDSGINSDWNFDPNNQTLYGSGHVIIIEKDFSEFQNIEIQHSFRVSISEGNNYSVSITIDDNLLDHLVARQNGNKIILGLENGYNYKNIILEAEITMPDIDLVDLSGASSAVIKNFNFSHDFSMHLSGASSVVGSINTGDVDLDLSGASSVLLNGDGENFYINCSGASTINFKNFKGKNASINLSGTSVSTLNITGDIEADLSGTSILYYAGDPTFSKLHVSGQSKLIKL
ncbi:MAG: DUF2807 domain-containing protein [Bacteroidetes bacterium]|nr:DUF2807 domain-containing protein [Bacteroidota bacterium]